MSFADKVSAVRIFLIPIFVYFLVYSRAREDNYFRWLAFFVFVLAVLSDFFDGMVARIKKEKSPLGQIIDPLADKALLLTAFVTLYLLDFNIYLWLVVIVVSRDLIILLGLMVLHFLKIEVQISPSIWGKLTTFSQMAAVLWILTDKNPLFISLVAVIFTAVSGIDYFARGVIAVNDQNHSARS